MRDGPRGFRQGSTCLAVLRIHLGVYIISFTGLSPFVVYLSRYFNYNVTFFSTLVSYYPSPKTGLGSFPFARHYLGNRFFFLFLQLLRCFSSLGYTHYNYIFIIRYWRITTSRFPHSDSSGSKITYISPKIFVVCHVLHLLLMPRHSPYALINLITIFVILI